MKGSRLKVPESKQGIIIQVRRVSRTVLVACDDNDLLEELRKAAEHFGHVEEVAVGAVSPYDFELTVRATFNVGGVVDYLRSFDDKPPGPEDIAFPVLYGKGARVRNDPGDIILD